MTVMDCPGLTLPALPPVTSSAAYARTVTVYTPVRSEVLVVVGAVAPDVYGTLMVG